MKYRLTEKNKNRLFIGGLCLLTFILYLIFGDVRYESNDDMIMNLIAAGAYSPDSQYLVFYNIFYGYFLKLLYFLFPDINCYLWLMLFLNFSCILILCILLSEMWEQDMRILWIITLFVNCILAEQYYNSLQFTKNAALYSLTAYVLVVVYYRIRGVRYLTAASFFAFLAIAVRSDCFLLMTPFGGLAAAAVLWTEKEKNRQGLRQILLPVVLFPVIFLLSTAGNEILYAGGGWGDYRSFNRARASACDYSILDYDRYGDALKENGIAEEDLKMAEIWDFDDPSFFTTERMEMIAEICGGDRKLVLSPQMCREILGVLAGRVRSFRIVLIGVLLLFGLFLFGSRLLKGMTALFTVMILGVYWYLSCLHRIFWRAEYGIWIGTVFLLLVVLPGQFRFRWDRKKAEIVLLFLVSFLFLKSAVSLWGTFSESKHYHIVRERTTTDAFFRKIKADPDHYYLGDTKTFSPEETMPYLFSVNADYRDYYTNYSSLGGWLTASPFTLEILRENGIENPLRDLLKEKVYLASMQEHAGVVLDYLRLHYREDAVMERAGSIEGIDIWKYHAGQRESDSENEKND